MEGSKQHTGITMVPKTLDCYPASYEKVLRKVMEEGYMYVELDDIGQATKHRLGLGKYFKSLQHYEPDGDLAKFSKHVEIRYSKGKGYLLIVDTTTLKDELSRAVEETVKLEDMDLNAQMKFLMRGIKG